MLIHAFRAGEHVDSLGRQHTYTRADIARIAQQYNDQIGVHEAPLVKGHPADNAPAYGWVKRLVADGDDLKAEVDQIDRQFLEDWRAGRFKKKSISLYPDGKLRHIGMLGAVPPAVKGLADAQFAEGGRRTFEFEEGVGSGELDPPSQTEGRGMEEEIKQILALLTKLVGEKEKPAEKPEEKPAEQPKPTEAPEQFSEREKLLAAEVLKLKSKEFDTDFREFLNSEEMKGRVTKEAEPKIISIARSLAKADTISFGEGEDKETVSALDAYKAVLKGMPTVVEFGEMAKVTTANVRTGDVESLAKSIVASRQ